MATRPVADSSETSDYYATQAALGVATATAVREAWPVLDPGDLAGSFPDLRLAAAGIGSRYSLAAISLAADYYENRREAVGVTSPFRTPVIDAPTLEQVEAYIDKAAAGLLADGKLAAMVDEVYLAEIATQIEREVEGSAQKVVSDSGRNELIAAIEADREARGWARVTRPNACSFCRMLATRGAVYKSKETASFRAHVPIDGRGGTCQCTAEPLFARHYEPPAHVREDMALWERVTGGLSGADAANEFRRHIEGRADGRRSRRRRAGEPKWRGQRVTNATGQRLGFEHLTVPQLQHHLAIVEALLDSDYRTKQLARLTNRLAELAK